MTDGIVALKDRLAEGVPGRFACRGVADTSWDDVTSDLRWAERHLRSAAALFEEGGFGFEHGSASDMRRMALMHMLLCGYNAFESAMLRIVLILGEEPPSGTEWSFLLARQLSRPRSGRPALLADADLLRATYGLRGYRIVALQAYGDFDSGEAALAVRDAKVVCSEIGPAFVRFGVAISGAASTSVSQRI